jgi:hypothetical protein
MIQQSPTEERAAQDARRAALIERLSTTADLCCATPLAGDLGDVAYDLLRQAAAQIASDRQRIASQAAQPAEADGWVMVPREPTEAMWFAFDYHNGDKYMGRTTWLDAWTAMIAATPKASTSTAGEVEDAFRAGWDAREMKDSGPSAAGYCDDSYNADLAWSLYDKPLATPPAPNDDLRAALEWYAERVADCRKITPEGDNARQALDLDGGKRARAALKENRRG